MKSGATTAPEAGAGEFDAGYVARVQRRTIRTLLASQVFGSVGASMAFAVSALAATSLAHSATRAGVAQGISSVGTIVATLVLAKVTIRLGRRPALSLGYLIAAVGGFICVIAIARHHFIAFVLGSALFAVANATNLQSRFAATDLARVGRVSTGISLVVWMSTVGAVVGPNLATFGGKLARHIDMPTWSGAYALGALGFLAAAAILACWLRPDPLRLALALRPADGASAPPSVSLRQGLAAISSSTAKIALLAAGVGQAVMVGVMTWTPLHMSDGGSGVGWIGVVLSGHLLGMYAFSPILGWIADRIGKLLAVAFGCLLMMAALVLASPTTGRQHVVLLVALWLLGVSWSLTFITGSALFTEHIEPGYRAAAQGIFDVVVWTATAMATFAAGWVLDVFGYRSLGVCGIAVMAIPASAAWIHYFTSRRRGPDHSR